MLNSLWWLAERKIYPNYELTEPLCVIQRRMGVYTVQVWPGSCWGLWLWEHALLWGSQGSIHTVQSGPEGELSYKLYFFICVLFYSSFSINIYLTNVSFVIHPCWNYLSKETKYVIVLTLLHVSNGCSYIYEMMSLCVSCYRGVRSWLCCCTVTCSVLHSMNLSVLW